MKMTLFQAGSHDENAVREARIKSMLGCSCGEATLDNELNRGGQRQYNTGIVLNRAEG